MVVKLDWYLVDTKDSLSVGSRAVRLANSMVDWLVEMMVEWKAEMLANQMVVSKVVDLVA